MFLFYLFLNFEIARISSLCELAAREQRFDRAVRFAVVSAAGKSAFAGNASKLRVTVVERFLREFAHLKERKSWRIEHGTAQIRPELRLPRRVFSALGLFGELANLKRKLRKQRV